MTLQDIKDVFKECRVTPEVEITEEVTLRELGVDSLDMSLIVYELNERVNKELDFKANQTVGQVLEYINNVSE